MILPAVLDACCGPRMMWFDSKDRRALFIDKRQETHRMDRGPRSAGRSPAVIAPDVVADFSAMPFPDESFYLVAFDPPHIQRGADTGYLVQKYGKLPADWREILRRGFAECFRVLRPHGVLIFKWAETNFGIADVLELTPHQPLFGHRTTRSTHWYVFMKDGESPRQARAQSEE